MREWNLSLPPRMQIMDNFRKTKCLGNGNNPLNFELLLRSLISFKSRNVGQRSLNGIHSITSVGVLKVYRSSFFCGVIFVLASH